MRSPASKAEETRQSTHTALVGLVRRSQSQALFWKALGDICIQPSVRPGRCPYGLAKQADSFTPVIVTFNEIWVEIIVRSGGKSGSHCCYYLRNTYVCQELLNAVNDHTMGSLKKQTFVSHSSGDQTPAPSRGSQAAPSEGFSGGSDFGLWFLPAGCMSPVFVCHAGEREIQGIHLGSVCKRRTLRMENVHLSRASGS